MPRSVVCVWMVFFVLATSISCRATELDRRAADAVAMGNLAGARELYAQGADINAAVEEGHTVLMMAAGMSEAEVVRFLLDNGAEPDLRGPKGRTALMLAAAKGRHDNVAELLEFGADPALVARDGATALARARDSGDARTIALLEAAMGEGDPGS